MVKLIGETDAFNAVFNLAKPYVDAFLQLKHPIPGIDFTSRMKGSPLHKNTSAEQIFNWFTDEFKFTLNHVRENQHDDDIYFTFVDYFQMGEQFKYINLEAFCQDIDWHKLQRELMHP